MVKNVVIVGTGDFARVAHVYLSRDTDWNIAAFAVHERYVTEPTFRGLPLVKLETLVETHPPCDYELLVAIGFSGVNAARAAVFKEVRASGYQCVTYVNSRVCQWGEVSLGQNVFIFENNVLQPFVTIGDNVIIWSGNHIGHDATVGDHCFIASHAVISGNVKIGPRCFIGVNATIRDGVDIAEECVIGAGALVLANTEPRQVLKGIPAELSKVPSNRLRGM